jgi:hypothetical protein
MFIHLFDRGAGGRSRFGIAIIRGIVERRTPQLIGRAVVLRIGLAGGRTSVRGLFDTIAGGRTPSALAGIVALGIRRLIGRAALLSRVVGTGTGVLVGSG